MESVEPLELSLRNLITQQASMIEELRKQNQAVLENQNQNIRDAIIKELKPLLDSSSSISEITNNNTNRGYEINSSSERAIPPPAAQPHLEQKKPKQRRRQRPKSPKDENGFVVKMDGGNPSEEYVSIKGFEKGRSGRMNNSGRQQLIPKQTQQQHTTPKSLQSSPLLISVEEMKISKNQQQKGKNKKNKKNEISKFKSKYEEEEEEVENKSGSDSDEEGMYGYKNALWLKKSRDIIETVKDDQSVLKLYDLKGEISIEKKRCEAIKESDRAMHQDGQRDVKNNQSMNILGGENGTGGTDDGLNKETSDNPFQVTKAVTSKSYDEETHNVNKYSSSSSKQRQGNDRNNDIDKDRDRGLEGDDDDEDSYAVGDEKGVTSSSRYEPAPAAAGEFAWENEIARNILNLYASKVKIEDGIEQAMKKRFNGNSSNGGVGSNSGNAAGSNGAGNGGGERRSDNLQPLSARLTPRGSKRVDVTSLTVAKEEKNNGTAKKKNDNITNKSSTSKQSPTNQSKVGKVNKKVNSQVTVAAPRSTSTIWFTGSGSVVAEWTALEEGEEGQNLQAKLDAMEEGKEYSRYIATVESFLEARLRAALPSEVTQKLWRQLVVTMNAFASRCIDQKSFATALELLSRGTKLASNSEIFNKREGIEMIAFINDTYGYYYMKRGKYEASLSYCEKSMKAHVKFQDWAHVAKSFLHCGSVLAKLNRKDEAIRCNAQVLTMVENGRLEVGGTAPQRLCLVAVCYHNIAVEQLHMKLISEACVSAQNARRLARLCLSYSTRFLKNFEYTHQVALEELSGIATDKNNKEATRMFKRLLKQL